jgi:hypothetical protein
MLLLGRYYHFSSLLIDNSTYKAAFSVLTVDKLNPLSEILYQHNPIILESFRKHANSSVRKQAESMLSD